MSAFDIGCKLMLKIIISLEFNYFCLFVSFFKETTQIYDVDKKEENNSLTLQYLFCLFYFKSKRRKNNKITVIQPC